MSIIMNDIKNYIDFLRKSGFEVSLAVCGDNAIYGDDLPDLYNYSVHNNRVCSYMKSNGKTNGLCVAAKDKLRKNPPCGACSSVCYAGVRLHISCKIGRQNGRIGDSYGIPREK